MAEIGLGYGSEFQLMRFLGHHRNDLYELIHKATHTSESIEWLDYPYENDRLSGDGELKGIECFSRSKFKLKNYYEIKAKWKEFWPQRGTAMNWDGIFKMGDTFYFVEAKAHKDESYQKCSAEKQESIDKINEAFKKTQDWLGANPSKDWIKTDCYQLANRLAFLCFCNQECKINAKLLYMGFINGFRLKAGEKYIGINDEVHTEEEWMGIWKKELDTLGLSFDKTDSYLYFIHPDCDPNRKIND